MAYVITSKCERCGSCADVCPSDAIFHVEDDADWPTYYIYPENCIECASCEAECPEEAIFYEDDVPEELADAVQKNKAFFETGPGKDLV
ncbi:MAG: ferredoxin family protein [Anaerolineales bacterium]|nr:ferredoxin family protein [Anaerolineales bacterium]